MSHYGFVSEQLINEHMFPPRRPRRRKRRKRQAARAREAAASPQARQPWLRRWAVLAVVRRG